MLESPTSARHRPSTRFAAVSLLSFAKAMGMASAGWMVPLTLVMLLELRAKA
jgi:hypothetical protein